MQFARLLAFVSLALWWGLPMPAASRPQTRKQSVSPVFEQVATFEQPPLQPFARLLYVPADGNYYGTTTAGGAYGKGAVFRMTPAGVGTTLVSFTGEGGSAPGEAPDAGLVLGPDGSLYGTTLAGGAEDYGTIFKVSITGHFTPLVSFTDSGSSKGSVPGELILGSDNLFYGTTQAGGAEGYGTVFRMTPAGAITTLVQFTGTTGNFKGSNPLGTLAMIGDTLYGVTQFGGSLDLGTVFKVSAATPGNGWQTLVEFTGVNGDRPGSFPAAGLCVHADGMLYGTTEGGAEVGSVLDLGTLFRVAPNGSFALLKRLNEATGWAPAATLRPGPGGFLYGTASAGGAEDRGTIFSTTAGGVVNVLASFTGASGNYPGEAPRAALIFSPTGALVGTTSAGGLADTGTCFQITTAGGFTHLTDFTTPGGWNPAGGPTVDGSGALLVPMERGGLTGNGTLLKVTPAGVTTVTTTFGGVLGDEPAGALLRSSDAWYGVTAGGGALGRGTFFRYTPAGGAVLLSSFATATGATPEGPPLLGADGFFYVVAREGGAYGRGAILRFDSSGHGTAIVSFSGTDGLFRGTRPRAPLAVGPEGSLYGVTEAGGSHDRGTIFRLNFNGQLDTLLNFAASPQANTPKGGLVLSPDGKFYGTTSTGGPNGKGTLFSVTTAGVVSTVFAFTGSSGTALGDGPAGGLLVAPDGTLYGTTTALTGGMGSGTIFRVSPAGAYVALGTFTGSSGAMPGGNPQGQLAFGADGYLYGTTSEEGVKGGGTLFRLKQLGPHVGTDEPGFFPGTVTLRGTVQTGGETTATFFEYGTTTTLGSTTPAVNVGPGGSPANLAATLSNLSPGTTMYYRARGSNPSGSSLGPIRSFTVPTPLNAWKLAYFGSTAMVELADSDADGQINLAEYGLLKVPTVADSDDTLQPVLRDYPEGRRLSLSLLRDPTRMDITVEVLASTSIAGPWTVIASSVQGAPFSGPGYVSGDSATPGLKTVEIRDVVNIAGQPSRFLRVRVSH